MFRFFESLTNPFPQRPIKTPPETLLAFIRYFMRGSGKMLVIVMLLSTVIASMEVMLFSFMGDLVDWLSESDRETFLQDYGTQLLGMGLVVVVVLPIVILLNSAVKHQSLMGNFPMAIRWQAHRYMLRQSLQFYQDEFAGRVATKIMQAALSVRHSVMAMVDVLVYVLVYFTAMIVTVGIADKRLILPMVIWVIVYIGLQMWLLPKMKRVSTEQAHARSTMTGRVVDSYTNINTVKLFSDARHEEAYAKDSMQGFMQTVYRQMRLATIISVSLNTLNYLLAFSMAALSITLWLDDAISIGAISVAIALALRLNGMSQWIMWEISGLFENVGMAIDSMGMLSQPLSVTDAKDAKPLEIKEGGIEFEGIRFHYGKEDGVIEALNLSIQPGEKVGLVGRSGAGKSTILNLLLRLYDLEGGKIRIDGQDISKVTQESLRAQIGMVTQETSLLHRTVRENILYGKPNATEAELQTAIRMAEADSFIYDLTDPQGRTGLDAMVGERGVKLSGGQRQRVAIARVLLKNAPILLLDEATSALDSEVEAAIQSSLYQLMEGKTVIAIAHRLSTIAALDRLIVLDEGEIVEQGTHEELIQQNGLYAQLWQHQSGGFLLTEADATGSVEDAQ